MPRKHDSKYVRPNWLTIHYPGHNEIIRLCGVRVLFAQLSWMQMLGAHAPKWVGANRMAGLVMPIFSCLHFSAKTRHITHHALQH